MRIVFGLLLAGTALSAQAKDLATVSGKTLTEKEFVEAADALGPRGRMMLKTPAMRKQFLDHLIESRLLAEIAQKEGVKKSPVYKARILEAERQILANIYTDQFIKKKTSDKEMKKFFDNNKELFSDKKVKARHILVKEEDKAKKLLADAKKKGADFAAMAKEHSTGPSGKSGGDLGTFGRGQMVKEFEEAAFSTKPGTVHPNVVKTRFGFHIIKVEEIQGGDKVKFADVKDKVKGRMERDLRTELIDDLKKKAKVKINDKNLESLNL